MVSTAGQKLSNRNFRQLYFSLTKGLLERITLRQDSHILILDKNLELLCEILERIFGVSHTKLEYPMDMNQCETK